MLAFNVSDKMKIFAENVSSCFHFLNSGFTIYPRWRLFRDVLSDSVETISFDANTQRAEKTKRFYETTKLHWRHF